MTARYLALGDSYTIGEGVAVEERWPDQLVAKLRERKIDIADPHIIAATNIAARSPLCYAGPFISPVRMRAASSWFPSLTGASRRSQRGGASMVTRDGLHPSAGMYAQWTAAILSEAMAILSSGTGSTDVC